MNDFDTLFEQFQFAQKAEASIKEFSNWLFGISIGLCALMISLIDSLCVPKTGLIIAIFIFVLVISMVNVFLTGFTKFLIFKRETRMMTSYGTLKKMAFFHRIQQGSTLDQEKIEQYFKDWSTEHNKLSSITRFFNFSILLNFITTLTAGISVIMIVLKN